MKKNQLFNKSFVNRRNRFNIFISAEKISCVQMADEGIKTRADLLLGGLALSLEDLHDDLLFLDEESAHNLLTDSLVAQDT
jgi:hypothetical protein